MKKTLVYAMTLTLALGLAGCGQSGNDDTSSSVDTQTESTTSEESSESPEESSEASDSGESEAESSESGSEAEGGDTEAKSEGVMTHDEYVAAALDSEVVIETYVQAKQSWWEDKATLYTQDKDGAYFIYELPCSEEEYEKLVPGTKIKVTGYKSEWSGEVEITDASYEILEGTYIAPALDVTALLGTDELIDHQNEFVSFKGMTVEAKGDDGAAFLYKYDGSGQDGDDLYFDVSLDGKTYTFTVESYLCDNTTDVYKAVTELKVGDKIDMEGFLYWYEGVNPHITSVTAAQ